MMKDNATALIFKEGRRRMEMASVFIKGVD